MTATVPGLVTLDRVQDDPWVLAYIERGDEYLDSIGYTEHGLRHANLVAHIASNILRRLGYSERTAELAAIAGFMHDMGNAIGRADHGISAALLAQGRLEALGCDPRETVLVMTAVGTGAPTLGTSCNSCGWLPPEGAADALGRPGGVGPPHHGSGTMSMKLGSCSVISALKLEKLIMFIILVAAFGIMNTLITMTVQKTREIGVLKALGARTWQVISVFLIQGMVIGVFGVASGLALGMTLIRWRNEVSQWLAHTLGVEIFPRSVYQFNEIPAEVVPSDVAMICLCAFIICSLAALIPAWIASRLDPVKALRCE